MEPFNIQGKPHAYVIGWYDIRRKHLTESFPVANWDYEDTKAFTEVTVLLVQSQPQTDGDIKKLDYYIKNAQDLNIRLILPPPFSGYPSRIRRNVQRL